jgi:AbrB family looped-hinge helix DNA binding protein
MQEYHTKIAPDGRIVLPASFRRELGLEAGDGIVIKLEDEELRIFSLSNAVKRAQTSVRKYMGGKKNLTDLFIVSRREAAKRE